MSTRYLNTSVYIIAISAILLLTSCGGKSGTGSPDSGDTSNHKEDPNTVALTGSQFKTAGIIFGEPETRQIAGAVKVNGFLDTPPQQLASISVPMGGIVRYTNLLQGMQVKKGAVIAVLENLDYIQLQQDYLEAKSQLEYATADLHRQQELARENVNALKTLQQAGAAFQSLNVRENALRQKLALLNAGNIRRTVNVYAPISGYVTQVNVNPGQFVSPADILFRIVNTEHLHAELTIFEKDIHRLKTGQKVRFTLADETKERTATVHLIGREISPERTVRVHCHLDQEDTQLLPGTYLQALIETGMTAVKALPEEAIVSFENKSYVFVKAVERTGKGGDVSAGNDTYHFSMVEVTKGNSELGFTEVAFPETIADGTRFVVKGAYDLLAKLKNSGDE
jgi:membrane fusion protein, heavy metal efflux system